MVGTLSGNTNEISEIMEELKSRDKSEVEFSDIQPINSFLTLFHYEEGNTPNYQDVQDFSKKYKSIRICMIKEDILVVINNGKIVYESY